MTSLFDRQTNCLTQPERELVFGFLLIHLDPLVPGMLLTAYELAWAAGPGVGSEREAVFRHIWRLVDVPVEEFTFVVSAEGAWFGAWATSIGAGESDPSAPCICDAF